MLDSRLRATLCILLAMMVAACAENDAPIFADIAVQVTDGKYIPAEEPWLASRGSKRWL